MKLATSYIFFRSGRMLCWLFLTTVFCVFCSAQKVAIIDLSEPLSAEFAEPFSNEIEKKFATLDTDLARSAFGASKHLDPLNMTTEEAKQAGMAIGCDVFILIRTETQRRASIETTNYYDAYAAVYVVNSRTGNLLYQTNPTAKGASPQTAKGNLVALASQSATNVANIILAAQFSKTPVVRSTDIEELPAENSPASKNFRAPIPYRRIRPEYTASAYLFGITATVEILVDLDANGAILRTDITRWAGFGLDESVENTVRAMNWRPAERNGKPLPMRVLLRYNFKKSDAKP